MVMINDQDGLPEWECRYIYNHDPKGISTGWKTSCCVASLLGRPVGRSFGTRRQMVINQGGMLAFSFLLSFNLQDHQTHLRRHSISICLPKIH